MNPYRAYVDEIVRNLEAAKQLPLGNLPAAPEAPRKEPSRRALVFSPHPDDESIIGALPLRLRRETGHRVGVVAVTQGSRQDRQVERLEEMRGACGYLGFELIPTVPNGLLNINPRARGAQPEAWAAAVAVLRRILGEQKPEVVFVPHAQDSNSTHQGTHLLVMDALRALPEFRGWVVETEFWSAMEGPNVMVASSAGEVADLVAAISFHKGEVARNPYHLLLPAWMADNVRRGGELVGGQGGAAPDFHFSTLYRLNRWINGALSPAAGRKILPPGQGLDALFD